jgi:LysM repeat protein
MNRTSVPKPEGRPVPRKWIWGLVWLAAGLMLGGCWVSEADYHQALQERDRLKEELGRAGKENKTLKEAILEIYRERDGLNARIHRMEKLVARAEGSAEGSAPPETPPGPKPDAAVRPPADVAPPADRPPPEEKKPEEPPKPAEPTMRYYYTSQGDRLSDVARRTGIGLATLQQLNGLSGDPQLALKQRIRIQ